MYITTVGFGLLDKIDLFVYVNVNSIPLITTYYLFLGIPQYYYLVRNLCSMTKLISLYEVMALTFIRNQGKFEWELKMEIF